MLVLKARESDRLPGLMATAVISLRFGSCFGHVFLQLESFQETVRRVFWCGQGGKEDGKSVPFQGSGSAHTSR